MDDLVQWLRAVLDAEAEEAREAADGDSGEWFMGDKWNVFRVEDETPNDDEETNALVCWGNVKPQSEHIARHDPARVLRDIDAKRATIAEYEKAIRKRDALEPNTPGYRHWDNRSYGLYLALRHAAAVYAHRPGYEEAVAPIK